MATQGTIKNLFKKTILLTTASAALMASAVVFSGHKSHCNEHGKGKHGGEISLMIMEEVLDLSSAQVTQIEAIHERKKEARRAMKEKRQANKKSDGGIMALNPADADYLNKVEQLAEMKSQRMTARMIEKAKVRAEIYAVLSPEQQAKMDELHSKMQDKRAKHKKRGDMSL